MVGIIGEETSERQHSRCSDEEFRKEKSPVNEETANLECSGKKRAAGSVVVNGTFLKGAASGHEQLGLSPRRP